MGLVKQQWEQMLEQKTRDLRDCFQLEYTDLRPIGTTDYEEHYMAPNNTHIIYDQYHGCWLALL